MLYWCDNCILVICGHCIILNGEHKDHVIRSVAAKHSELRSHAATLTPRIATLAQQLADETALTITLRTQTETQLTALAAATARYATQALALPSALAAQLRLFLSQRIAQEKKALALTQSTLASMTGATDAPTITRLARLLQSRPVWPFTPANSGQCADASVSADVSMKAETTLADTPWASARAAFDVAFTDTAAALVPREVVREIDVPLAELVLPAHSRSVTVNARGSANTIATSRGPVIQLGTVELCGVRFKCNVRRGCGCGASPLLLPLPQQRTEADATTAVKSNIIAANTSAGSKSATANLTPGGAIEGASSLHAFLSLSPECQCALVGEVEASILSPSLVARYEACGARSQAITELIETDDYEDEEDGRVINGKVNKDNEKENKSSSMSHGGIVDVIEFGNVCVKFTVVSAVQLDDSAFDNFSDNDSDSEDNSRASQRDHNKINIDDNNAPGATMAANHAMLKLTDANKRTTAVALAKAVDAEAAMTASPGLRWRVRVAVAFPDVFHEKRALQLLADTVPADWETAQLALIKLEAEKASKAKQQKVLDLDSIFSL